MSTITTQTSFTKLRNGSWGIKGSGLRAGLVVGVVKRDGSTSNVTVDRIVWDGGNVQIASIKQGAGRTASTHAARPAGHSCECCGAPNARYARDLSGIGGYACRSCNDGTLSFC